jgi:hypothetical protein
MNTMNRQATSEPSVEADLEADVDTVIAACGGSARAAIRALLIANEFLSGELERARASQSVGCVRGREAGRSPRKRLGSFLRPKFPD